MARRSDRDRALIQLAQAAEDAAAIQQELDYKVWRLGMITRYKRPKPGKEGVVARIVQRYQAEIESLRQELAMAESNVEGLRDSVRAFDGAGA